jgi:hypothetical protein
MTDIVSLITAIGYYIHHDYAYRRVYESGRWYVPHHDKGTAPDGGEEILLDLGIHEDKMRLPTTILMLP